MPSKRKRPNITNPQPIAQITCAYSIGYNGLKLQDQETIVNSNKISTKPRTIKLCENALVDAYLCSVIAADRPAKNTKSGAQKWDTKRVKKVSASVPGMVIGSVTE